MKFLSLLAIITAIGTASAASVPLSNRQVALGALYNLAPLKGDECTDHTGEYCCTWEGCRSCCPWEKCDLSIDAAQGKCVPNW
ncbi:hypothetical protein AnigIFM56816_001817 [Aspergillus niger]|nr:hypothetical protein AnigIFM56816_001817 [Aspergillus niger]